MKHFTMTGPDAGTYFCRAVIARIGEPTRGAPVPGDERAHYAYAPPAYLAAPDVCPGCAHAATCDTVATGDACPDCTAMGWV